MRADLRQLYSFCCPIVSGPSTISRLGKHEPETRGIDGGSQLETDIDTMPKKQVMTIQPLQLISIVYDNKFGAEKLHRISYN